MADKPFTGFYSASLRDMVGNFEPKDIVLFVLLSSYADERGVCWPGLRELHKFTGWRADELRYRLDRLERQGLFRYLRRGAQDSITGRFQADVYQMNPSLILTKKPVTYAPENAEREPVTHAAENAEHDLLRIAPSEHTQPESITRYINQNQEPESLTSTNKQTNPSFEGSEGSLFRMGADSWDQEEIQKPKANTNTKSQATGSPAPAGTKPAPAGQVNTNTPPGSAAPPVVPIGSYRNALSDSSLEALANEVYTLAAPTKLYNARELVMTYGAESVRKSLGSLVAAKSKGNVYNPMGLLTKWLRMGAVSSEPEQVEPRSADEWKSYFEQSSYRDFIQS